MSGRFCLVAVAGRFGPVARDRAERPAKQNGGPGGPPFRTARQSDRAVTADIGDHCGFVIRGSQGAQ